MSSATAKWPVVENRIIASTASRRSLGIAESGRQIGNSEQPADPAAGAKEMHGVVGAMQDADRAALHRRVARQAEARERKRRQGTRAAPNM